ncbi:hypothetical protein NLI96_g9940 [Meripilus lineatus]|uniref:Uncharacterized protein n=1 Tax=Meripilus lineatus TaxID=2056292 RepID=A0AAD5YES0_9APHY|nr:hypothetical protein NLI96_g9940 [Physisporinus lineatus]
MRGTRSKVHRDYRASFKRTGAIHAALDEILSMLSQNLITLTCVSALGFHEAIFLSLKDLQFPSLTEFTVYHSEISVGHYPHVITGPVKFPVLKYFHVAFTVGDFTILRHAPALTHLRITGDSTTLSRNLASWGTLQEEYPRLERVGLSLQNDFRILTSLEGCRHELPTRIDLLDPLPGSSDNSDEVRTYGYNEVDSDWRRGVEGIGPYWVAESTC